MLTQEQINNLKEGDPIVIHTTFMRVDEDDDIHFKAPAFNAGYHEGFISRDYVSLPTDSQSTATAQLLRSRDGSTVNRQPRRSSAGAETGQSKYPPTRLFKKGDVVTPRIYLGRKDKVLEMGEKYIVTANEIAGDTIALKHHFTLRPRIAQTCFLELVTPVEKIGPYTVEESALGPMLFIYKKEKTYITIPYKNPSDVFQTREEALAAAHAECDRLNAEYRKEHSND